MSFEWVGVPLFLHRVNYGRSSTGVLVPAARVRASQWKALHSVLRSRWLCSFPGGDQTSVRYASPQHTWAHRGGYFCFAAVGTVSQGWSKACPGDQIFMVPATCATSGWRPESSAFRAMMYRDVITCSTKRVPSFLPL